MRLYKFKIKEKFILKKHDERKPKNYRKEDKKMTHTKKKYQRKYAHRDNSFLKDTMKRKQ